MTVSNVTLPKAVLSTANLFAVHVVHKTLQRATQNDMNYRVSYMLHKISWIQNETLSSKSQVIHKTLQKSTKIEIPIGWGTCCIRI